MNNIIEKQLKSFENNLKNMTYYDKLKEYNKARQIIQNSYDSYAYFRMILFDKLIYQTISDENDLKRAIEEVRDALNFLLKQIKLIFPKVFLFVKEENLGYDFTIDRTLIEKFKMKIGKDHRMAYYLTIANKIASIIDAVDYVYLSNINIQDPDIHLGKTLTVDLETNEILSFDHVVYNIKQRIKTIFKLYE